jgi:hypothetical protein
MSFLNLSIAKVAYEDALPTVDPKERLFDYVTSDSGLRVTNPSGCKKTVGEGTVTQLATTSRTLGYDATSQFEISFPTLGSQTTRFRWTGTGLTPAFRTLRAIGGGADTTVDLVRVSPTALKISYFSGTALTLNNVVVGDDLYFQKNDDLFTSPLQLGLLGQHYRVVDASATSVTIRDNGVGSAATGVVLGADYASVMRAFSSIGVQVGDKISFASAANLKYDNKTCSFTVTDVTDRDLYFINPYAVPEIAIPGANSFNIYDRMLSFISITATGALKLRFNSGVETVQMYEYQPGRSMFIGTLNVYAIYAVNDTEAPIDVVVQSCSF